MSLDNATHSIDCWRWHHACAVALVERLRDKRNAEVERDQAWQDGYAAALRDTAALRRRATEGDES